MPHYEESYEMNQTPILYHHAMNSIREIPSCFEKKHIRTTRNSHHDKELPSPPRNEIQPEHSCRHAVRTDHNGRVVGNSLKTPRNLEGVRVGFLLLLHVIAWSETSNPVCYIEPFKRNETSTPKSTIPSYSGGALRGRRFISTSFHYSVVKGMPDYKIHNLRMEQLLPGEEDRFGQTYCYKKETDSGLTHKLGTHRKGSIQSLHPPPPESALGRSIVIIFDKGRAGFEASGCKCKNSFNTTITRRAQILPLPTVFAQK